MKAIVHLPVARNASHVLATVCLPEFLWGGCQKCTKPGLRTENPLQPIIVKNGANWRGWTHIMGEAGGATGQSLRKIKPIYMAGQRIIFVLLERVSERKAWSHTGLYSLLDYLQVPLSPEIHLHFTLLFCCFFSQFYPVLCSSGRQMHYSRLAEVPKTPMMYNRPVGVFCSLAAQSSKVMFDPYFCSAPVATLLRETTT